MYGTYLVISDLKQQSTFEIGIGTAIIHDEIPRLLKNDI